MSWGLLPWDVRAAAQAIATKDAGLSAGVRAHRLGQDPRRSIQLPARDRRPSSATRSPSRTPWNTTLDGCTQIPIDQQSQGNNVRQRAAIGGCSQDPDVIFVGEVRDLETANVAMQAAMTGHLVYSTVHAKDSIGAIFRLLDLGVESYLVANAINLIIDPAAGASPCCPTCRKKAGQARPRRRT